LENSLNIVLSTSVPVTKEALLVRHKRQASGAFSLSQTSPMDGSGVTEEGSGITEESTSTTQEGSGITQEGSKIFLIYYFHA